MANVLQSANFHRSPGKKGCGANFHHLEGANRVEHHKECKGAECLEVPERGQGYGWNKGGAVDSEPLTLCIWAGGVVNR